MIGLLLSFIFLSKDLRAGAVYLTDPCGQSLQRVTSFRSLISRFVGTESILEAEIKELREKLILALGPGKRVSHRPGRSMQEAIRHQLLHQHLRSISEGEVREAIAYLDGVLLDFSKRRGERAEVERETIYSSEKVVWANVSSGEALVPKVQFDQTQEKFSYRITWHRRKVSPGFRVSINLMTQDQVNFVMGAGGASDPGSRNAPALGMSHRQVQEFVARLNELHAAGDHRAIAVTGAVDRRSRFALPTSGQMTLAYRERERIPGFQWPASNVREHVTDRVPGPWPFECIPLFSGGREFRRQMTWGTPAENGDGIFKEILQQCTFIQPDEIRANSGFRLVYTVPDGLLDRFARALALWRTGR